MDSFKSLLESSVSTAYFMDGKSVHSWIPLEFEKIWKSKLESWFFDMRKKTKTVKFTTPPIDVKKSLGYGSNHKFTNFRGLDKKWSSRDNDHIEIERVVLIFICLFTTSASDSHFSPRKTYKHLVDGNTLEIELNIRVILQPAVTYPLKDQSYAPPPKTKYDAIHQSYYDSTLEIFMHEITHAIEHIFGNFKNKYGVKVVPKLRGDGTKTVNVPHAQRFREWDADVGALIGLIANANFPHVFHFIKNRLTYFQSSRLTYKKLISKLADAGVDRTIVKGFFNYARRYLMNDLIPHYVELLTNTYDLKNCVLAHLYGRDTKFYYLAFLCNILGKDMEKYLWKEIDPILKKMRETAIKGGEERLFDKRYNSMKKSLNV